MAKFTLKPTLPKAEALRLLLISALPVHIWAVLMVFKEADILLPKRGLPYFIGFAGYLLLLAIIESLLLFGFVYLLSFLFPRRWDAKTSLAVASALALTVTFWAIFNESFFWLIDTGPDWFEWVLLRVHYRQKIVYPILILVVTASAALPSILLPRSKQLTRISNNLIDRLIFLTPFYLLLDIVGIAFMIHRTLT